MTRLAFPLAFLATTALSATLVTAIASDESSHPAAKPASTSPARAQSHPTRKPPLSIDSSTPTPQQTYLIRATLLALHDANRTGNYTVLRDAAGPTFQSRYSSADLAIAFSKARASIDLAPAALSAPRLSAPATINQQKALILSGAIPANGSSLRFEMEFEPVAGHWRLAALAVGTGPAMTASR
ncbi:MAG: hypothetical protein ABL898_02960 [Hyphomicrobiaceae bacterium]